MSENLIGDKLQVKIKVDIIYYKLKMQLFLVGIQYRSANRFRLLFLISAVLTRKTRKATAVRSRAIIAEYSTRTSSYSLHDEIAVRNDST